MIPHKLLDGLQDNLFNFDAMIEASLLIKNYEKTHHLKTNASFGNERTLFPRLYQFLQKMSLM